MRPDPSDRMPGGNLQHFSGPDRHGFALLVCILVAVLNARDPAFAEPD